MSTNWIKMRSSLLTNPKVIRMARHLASDRHFMDWWTRGTNKSCDEIVYEICDVTVVTRVVVGSLLSVWGSANECANSDGRVTGITLFEVDEMAGVPSFGKAMEVVGWAVEDDNGIRFPNFNEHNTVGKERSTGAKTGAERTKEYRDRKRADQATNGDASQEPSHGVTVTSQSDHREDKRREEKEQPQTPGFVTFWDSWPKSSRKGGKAECERVWRKDRLEAVAADIVAHVRRMATSDGWTKQGGEFVPAPLVYLRGKRWDGAELNGSSPIDSIFAGAL